MRACDADERRLVEFAERHAGAPVCGLERVSGGGNNRLYRVETAAGPLALKAYFHHPCETRDRLESEYAFVEFCWNQGLRWTPRPVARDRQTRLALFEFVAGERLAPQAAQAQHVAQAMAFFTQLNERRQVAEAHRLLLGAESCASLADHLNCVQRRLHRLSGVEPHTDIDRDAAAFVSQSLAKAWQRVSDNVRTQAAAVGLSLDEPLDETERCLSPSDFGFHNALVDSAGRMRFLDFEYAGWDDPAKMVCDFFCQPQVPVSFDHWPAVVAAALTTVADRRRHALRFELLLPVYRIKWCCIVLNDFLPVDNQRRRFAAADDPQSRKERQLAKAQHALQQVAA